MNFKIFPAHLTKDGQKVPLIKGWQTLATTDADQIKKWQDQFGDIIHFWGVPTGAANGIYVLDIDVKTANGWKTIENEKLETPTTLMQNTPSGGSHLIYKAPEGVHCPNIVGSGTDGLDTRGDGGWIAWYGNINNVSISPAPDWLFNRFKKPIKKVDGVIFKITEEEALNRLNEACEEIVNAPKGESNNILNIKAFEIGKIVGTGSLTYELAEQELLKAAKERGKPLYESKATVTSGLESGLKEPLTAPFDFKDSSSIPVITPSPIERWTPRKGTVHDLFPKESLDSKELFKHWSTEDIHITTADGGTGKTTLKLMEAICLALGERFLGFECMQPGAKSLFIIGEDDSAKIFDLIGKILLDMGYGDNLEVQQIVLDKIHVKTELEMCLIAKNKEGFLTINHDALNKLNEAIEDIQPKLIVFDPISSFWGSEAALNDMSRAVAKFMHYVQKKSNACVEMINHMGKSSSNSKDMSQFAGRGGSALPSHSRVNKTYRRLSEEEYKEMTGNSYANNKEYAILMMISKFSSWSPLLDKPFVVLRSNFTAKRIDTIKIEPKDDNKDLKYKEDDMRRVLDQVRLYRIKNTYPNRMLIVSDLKDVMSKDRVVHALNKLIIIGFGDRKLEEIDNPDILKSGKVLTVMNNEKGEEE